MKNLLTVKDWVCLLDDKALEAKMQAHRERAQRSGQLPGAMTEYLWRQVEITATADKVQLRLMNVDSEAASGGYWRGGDSSRTFDFTWDDLQDVEFVDSLLAREQVVVYRRVMTMLTVLKARVAVLREALSAF